MNKKIIAILLVFTLVITCFAACKKHDYETTKVGNLELLLYTDANGNTVINEDNQIIAVVTDSEGEILTYENGEEQTHYVQISGSYVGDGYIQNKNYKLVIPEGWRGNENDRIIKTNTDDNCYIHFTENKIFKDNENLDMYLEKLDQQNAQLIEGFKAEGYTLTVDKKTTTVGTNNLNSVWYAYKMVDGDGKIVHYAENLYFLNSKTLYSLNYICENGIGYDESFNFVEYAKTGFTFKD